MKALILAAGYGTRLRAIAKNKAKALLKVGGQSIIDHILDHLRSLAQLNEVMVVTNAKYFVDFSHWAEIHSASESFKITVVNDRTTSNEDRLGSIGDIDYVLRYLSVDDDLLVVGGDNLFNFDIDAFAAFASQKSDHVSMGVFDIRDKSQAGKFGVVELGQDKRIISFEEKPRKPKSSLIAMCFYYFPKKSLGLIEKYLVQSGKSDRSGDYIIWLMGRSEVYGYEFSGKWFDIGSVESYNEAQCAFEKS
jgi:glucose-1-phosphate thymidylyltransferase